MAIFSMASKKLILKCISAFPKVSKILTDNFQFGFYNATQKNTLIFIDSMV